MDRGQVDRVIREARSRGLEGIEFARYLTDAGVTGRVYAAYEVRKTLFFLSWCLVGIFVAWAASRGLIYAVRG